MGQGSAQDGAASGRLEKLIPCRPGEKLAPVGQMVQYISAVLVIDS